MKGAFGPLSTYVAQYYKAVVTHPLGLYLNYKHYTYVPSGVVFTNKLGLSIHKSDMLAM